MNSEDLEKVITSNINNTKLKIIDVKSQLFKNIFEDCFKTFKDDIKIDFKVYYENEEYSVNYGTLHYINITVKFIFEHKEKLKDINIHFDGDEINMILGLEFVKDKQEKTEIFYKKIEDFRNKTAILINYLKEK